MLAEPQQLTIPGRLLSEYICVCRKFREGVDQRQSDPGSQCGTDTGIAREIQRQREEMHRLPQREREGQRGREWKGKRDSERGREREREKERERERESESEREGIQRHP
jgi:hypothetical protein